MAGTVAVPCSSASFGKWKAALYAAERGGSAKAFPQISCAASTIKRSRNECQSDPPAAYSRSGSSRSNREGILPHHVEFF